MILSINITEKSYGNKLLYNNLHFDVLEGQKIGLIGRNGSGKSTLFNIITGTDLDYQGTIEIQKNRLVIASRQEHYDFDEITTLDYILADLPQYTKLHHIITSYPYFMANDIHKQQTYSDALEQFISLNYFQIEEELNQAFNDYQLAKSLLQTLMKNLSGGQKRMIELIKIQRARADLVLIDEPTNHMDYVAKNAFIKWLKSSSEAILVISHDRDVLLNVDKIIEIRDSKAYVFKGNYTNYLNINKNQITSEVNQYDLAQRSISNLKEDLIRFRRLKEKARNPGTIKRFKSLEEKTRIELDNLSKKEKPSFWIDRESSQELNSKMTLAYQQYKSKNIKLSIRQDNRLHIIQNRKLIEVNNLSLGFKDKNLFKNINFNLYSNQRIQIKGRNGTGKTTLIKAILAKQNFDESLIKTYEGYIAIEKNIKIGVYDQEINNRFLTLSLSEAMEQSLIEKELPNNNQSIKQLLSDYLFDPITDFNKVVEQLSGGQKARFQLIRMLLDHPELLILDEPTNHLDLPSIEELEEALLHYHGAIIYISHDSLFSRMLGGELINIE